MAVETAPSNAHMHHVHALVLAASANDFDAADAAFAHAFKLQPGSGRLPWSQCRVADGIV